MPKQSAGLLPFRFFKNHWEFFLVHPGGPFWHKKDLGAWSIAKGEIAADEDPLTAARREFTEETGFIGTGDVTALGAIQPYRGKTIHAWALAQDFDPTQSRSNSFQLEWPPHSGNWMDFPEVDRVGWFDLETATGKLSRGQTVLLERFLTIFSSSHSAKPPSGISSETNSQAGKRLGRRRSRSARWNPNPSRRSAWAPRKQAPAMKRPALTFFRGSNPRPGRTVSAASGTSPVTSVGQPLKTVALTCRLCGQIHAPIVLHRGQRAVCVRCRNMLARRSWIGGDATLAFTVTGLICAVPALLLPIATISKFGNQHSSGIFTGLVALWHHDMRLLAVWAAICGAVAPVLLLGVLAGHALSVRFGGRPEERSVLARVADALEHWSMPEVHVLAVLVSFVKLGSLVDVKVGPGLWGYAAMSIAILFAWRSFELEPEAETEAPALTTEISG